MADETIDYRVVLADLVAKRDKLNAAIAGIEQMLGMEGETSLAATRTETAVPTEIREDTFFGMSMPEAVRKYLQIVKRTQTPTQIADALVQGGFKSSSADLPNTINAGLNRRAKNEGDFVKVDRGLWGLAEWYPGMRRKGGGKPGNENEGATPSEGTSDKN